MTIITPKSEILKKATGRVLFARALEPRFMLDGAAAATVVEAAAPTEAPAADRGNQGEAQALVDSLAPAADNSESAANDCCTEIAFVDAGVENYEALIAGLPNGVEVIVLDANSDGIAQISAALEGRTGIEAIHILSHGNDGTAILGNAVLSNATIDGYASQIASWGEALVAKLAQLSGADIAASTDLTGAADKGGDWTLEHTTGVIEAANTVNAVSMAAFNDTLATVDTFSFSQTLNTSGGAATSSVNNPISIIGGEREITITPTAGTTSSIDINNTNAGQATFANGSVAESTVEILYDGVGTGGFAATDFTANSAGPSHDRFLFSINFADFTTNLTMEVTSAGGTSSATTGSPAPLISAVGSPFAMLYSSFAVTAGAGADFTALTSVKLTFATTVAATDLRFDFLATSDTTTIPPDPPGPPPTYTPPTDDPPPASPPPTSDSPVLNFEQQNPVSGDSDTRFPPLDPRTLSDPVPDYGTIGLHVGHSVNGWDASIHAQYDGNTTDIKSGIGSGEEFSLKNAVTGNQDANVNDAIFGTGGFGDSPNPGQATAEQQAAALNQIAPAAGSGDDNGQMLDPTTAQEFLSTGTNLPSLPANDVQVQTQVFSIGAGGQVQQLSGSDAAAARLNVIAPASGGDTGRSFDINNINSAFNNLAPTNSNNTGPAERFGLSNGGITRQQGSGGDSFLQRVDPVNRPTGQLLNPAEERALLGLDRRTPGQDSLQPRPTERFFLFQNGNIQGQSNDSGQQWSPSENLLNRDVDGNTQPLIGSGGLSSLESDVGLGVPGLSMQLDSEAQAFDERRAELLASLDTTEAVAA